MIRWRPGIGDPSVAGWLTALAYLAVGLLAVRHAIALGCGREMTGGTTEMFGTRRLRVFWWGTGVLLLLLAVNKQLDLQSLFTDVGRVWSKRQGWWENRRVVQRGFIVAVGLTAVAGLLAGLGVFWPERRRCGVALVGLAWLAGFVVIRAASMHHMDRLLGERVAGLRVNWLAELGGILTVYWGLRISERGSKRGDGGSRDAAAA
ncbi:MAG: hypothetical protein V3V20_11990 [Algisphaera sp.]